MNKRLILFAACVFIIAGCATKRNATSTYKVVEVHDTLRQIVVQADSVVVRDSVRVWMRGDTIHHDRWRTEYRDRWRDKVREVVKVQTDTLVQRDTTYVQARPSAVQKIKAYAEGVVLFVISFLSLLVVFRIIKFKV